MPTFRMNLLPLTRETLIINILYSFERLETTHETVGYYNQEYHNLNI
jgi:hypothetical protein